MDKNFTYLCVWDTYLEFSLKNILTREMANKD